MSVPITNDGIFENDEMFSAVISLTTPDASVFIRQSTAGVMIGNDDSMLILIKLKPPEGNSGYPSLLSYSVPGKIMAEYI